MSSLLSVIRQTNVKLFTIFVLICTTGCMDPDMFLSPQAAPPRPNPVSPPPGTARLLRGKIVMVTAPFHCPPCERLKTTLHDMQKKDALRLVGVRYITGSSREYPAKAYPTTYITCESGHTQSFTGAISERTIIKALEHGH